ncbi:hypothetical protein Rsub_08180 [Raphidocelis subcapitata]|uniref:Uncharacterized protein n=1 Tax=Raphidocelis subcapitata TaxID=307507 RepID=A0A2V0P797_9CHLO|nr:hypothetical protein Rsub_08180 [Raphidocelis subcapitata]|eukprot:GBF95744.1 hypothetical protein Rsub_08180 [Raphidocelis subcapitata]
MIVLIENAVVVQLWHLSEPHFASNLRLLYSTIIAWREQSVWTGVLEVVASSKTNAVQATLKAAAEAKARQNSFDTSPAKVASATVRTLLRKSLSAGLGNRSGGASAAAPAAAGNADRRTVAASSLASPPGKQEHAAVAMAAAADGAEQARLDGGLTPEHLRLSLERILDDRSHANAHLRRCIARAVRVFGMDTLVARLARVCGADESSMPDHAVEAALADVRLRLAADFNKRWQLLASLIDQIFRWALTVGYVLTMILIGVLLGSGYQ